VKVVVLSVKTPFEEHLSGPLRAERIDILQINVGYRCELECKHCHVEAGSLRKERMPRGIMEQCLSVLKAHPISTIDITGGSPELHPDFPWLVQQCGLLGRRLLVRTNGMLLSEERGDSFIDLYVNNRTEVVMSLPHTDPQRTNRQRGEGVFPKLMQAIGKLNARGYGVAGSGLMLDLVHNPSGAYLPGSQASLESHYRQTLKDKYGLSFNRLFCLTNMPIGRFLDYLRKTDNYDDYLTSLIRAFNPTALKSVMCRTTLSVAWDGRLYDCDFNQLLGLPTDHGAPDHISAFDMDKLTNRRIVVGNHCYGCTAGAGSSCQGEVT
jgi:radical SAM/Cys-rich protein